jgi:beta-glucosidase
MNLVKKYWIQLRKAGSLLFPIVSIYAFASGNELDQRIEGYLSQMTIEEKVNMLTRNGNTWSYSGCERLGIPDFTCHDGPHGVRNSSRRPSTAFPTTAARGAAFDRDLSYRLGVAEAKEFLAAGWDMRLGNCVDVNRHPLYGRAAESAGEDPYLCAEIGVAGILGTQDTGCIANVKHLILNTREDERIRKNNQAIIDERSLIEIYGFPFMEAVQKGNAWSMMTAHSRVNGLRSSESPYILNTLLRDYWGFRYFVLNDWSSVNDALKPDDVTVADVFNAGHDLETNSTNYHNYLADEVRAGRVSMERLDEAVGRVLRVLLLSGLVDGRKPGDPRDYGAEKHNLLCREAAQKSIVLLKNENKILPLSKTGTIALIGPNAAVLPVDGRGSARVNPIYTVTPLQAFSTIAPEATLLYARGCDVNSDRTDGFDEALRIADKADVVVFVGGLDATQEGESQDRSSGSSALPGQQQALINQLAKVNPNIVVTVISGGVCSLTECIDSIKGLLYGFYPGQEAGSALADVVFGHINPAGRMPVTMPKSDSQLPPFDDDHRNHIVGVGYRWYDAQDLEPQFAFGFGLSYTTFAYSNLRLIDNEVGPGPGLRAMVDVTNTGDRAGDEVVQLYLQDIEASVIMPQKQLRGFERIHLKPGESQTVELPISAQALSFWDVESKAFVVEAGDFVAMVGGSSDNLPLQAGFRIQETYTVPRPEPMPEVIPPPYTGPDPMDREASNPMFRFHAKDYDHASAELEKHEGGLILRSGDWIGFDNIDLGSWLNFVEVRSGASVGGCILELRLGGPKGRLIGSFEAPNTSIDTTKGTNVGTSDYGVFGVHDLYIVHRDEDDPDAAVVVDYWQIEK